MQFEVRKQFYDRLLKAVQDEWDILKIIGEIYQSWYSECFNDYKIRKTSNLLNNQ